MNVIHGEATQRVSHMCNKHLDAHTHVAQVDVLARDERTWHSRHFILQELAASSSLSFVSRLYTPYVIIRHYAVGQRREIASVREGIRRVKSWPIVSRIRTIVPVMQLV